MSIIRDIEPLTEFINDPDRFVGHVMQTKGPLFLTENGKTSIVIQDIESFERLFAACEPENSEA